MNASRRRWLHVAVFLAFVTLLVAFARGVDWRAAMAAVRHADAGLLTLATVANLLSLALKGVRWWVFLRPLGVRSLSLVLRATFAGASLNNLLVAQGGEGARVLLVSRATGAPASGVTAALALERLLDAVSYLALLVGGAWLLDLPEAIDRWRAGATVLLSVVALALIALTTSRGRASRSLSTASGVLNHLRRFSSSANELASPMRMTVAMSLSLLAWALQVATYHLVARAADLPIPLSGSIAAMLAVGISFLVRATPGNVGVFQVIYAMTAGRFGIAEAPAVAVALLIQTIQVIPTVVIGTALVPVSATRGGG